MILQSSSSKGKADQHMLPICFGSFIHQGEKSILKRHRSRRKLTISKHQECCYKQNNCDNKYNQDCDTERTIIDENGLKWSIFEKSGQQQQQFGRKLRQNYNLFNYLISAIYISSLIVTISNNDFIRAVDCFVININTQSTRIIPISIQNLTTSRRFNGEEDATTNNDTPTNTRLIKRTSGEVFSAKLQELDALAYLQRYGYMNGTVANANLISEDSFQEAVMSFQRFAGIPETGQVDNVTVKYMQMPRCGNKDRSGKGENGKKKRRRRKKRYALQGSKWKRQELTYRISQYPTRFLYKKHEVDGQIEKAFKIWSQVAPIDFVVKKEGRVHIDIRFASGEHGDGDPFDGPGNTLAHAYFPQYGGDAHFDDQEYWTVDSYAGTNIFQVAAHELGHSLGLGHSSVREALMAPFYQKYRPNFKLHADDILGIQALYGERSDKDSPPSTTSTTSTTTSTTTESSTTDRRSGNKPTNGDDNSDDDDDDNNNDGGGFFNFGGSNKPKPVDLCQDSTIDAITRTEDGNTYVFRGLYYWLIKNEGIASGYPAKISRDWDGLPGNLDAALTWSDGKTFFFKGDKYWRFFNRRREPGYPKQISAGFAGIPNNIDAAFVWSGNGKTYFFKKDKYWRFDSKQEPPVSSQYPKSIKNWSGLPTSSINAAFKWENGMTYFFKDDLYYRFDDREFEVDSSARPTFPRSTAEWWFGCTNSNLPIKKKKTSGDDDEEGGEGSDSNTNDSGERTSSSSTLLFHRKPNLSYETSSSELNSGSIGIPKLKPGGTSISRSFLTSLSALFPLSSSSSSSSSSPSSTSSLSSSNYPSAAISDDWSFHKGIGEEVRRYKNARSAGSGDKPLSSTVFSSAARRSIISPDNTRWTFPLSGSSSSREQSMSELRMAPPGMVEA